MCPIQSLGSNTFGCFFLFTSPRSVFHLHQQMAPTRSHRGEEAGGQDLGLVTWFHLDGLPEGEASANSRQLADSGTRLTYLVAPKGLHLNN